MKDRRQEWLLANGPCVECGYWNELEVDHIDPRDKKMNPALLWSLSPANPKRIAELAKCQVMCRIHHQEKTRAYLGSRFSGTKAPTAALTDTQLTLVRSLLANGIRGSDIAKQVGVSKFVVSRVKLGKAYSNTQSSVAQPGNAAAR